MIRIRDDTHDIFVNVLQMIKNLKLLHEKANDIMKKITVRAGKDSNCHVPHDEIIVTNINSAEVVDFVSKYKEDFLIASWENIETSDGMQFRKDYNIISLVKRNDWIVDQLVFGLDINRDDIDHNLTITLTAYQKQIFRRLNCYSRCSYLKEIAGDLVNKYRMWRVYYTKPFANEGWQAIKKHGTFEYVSCPQHLLPIVNHNSYSEDDWQKERAMMAGMHNGCEAYNEVMGY